MVILDHSLDQFNFLKYSGLLTCVHHRACNVEPDDRRITDDKADPVVYQFFGVHQVINRLADIKKARAHQPIKGRCVLIPPDHPDFFIFKIEQIAFIDVGFSSSFHKCNGAARQLPGQGQMFEPVGAFIDI